MRWFGIGLFLIVVIGVVGAFFATPWYSVGRLREAARNDNLTQLSDMVDYKSVRESLSEQLKLRFKAQMGALGSSSNPVGEAMAAIGDTIVDATVEQMVTPGLVGNMLRAADAGTDVALEAETAKDAPKPEGTPVDVGISYRNLNTVAASFTRADGTGQPMTLLLRRERFVFWKVFEIELPPSPEITAAEQEAAAEAAKPELAPATPETAPAPAPEAVPQTPPAQPAAPTTP
jgi:hypothetical protein